MAIHTIVPTQPVVEEQLLSMDEDHFAEMKSIEISVADLQKHFVAFANADGGDLYIGIRDKKIIDERINGFQKPEDANSIIDHLLTQTQPTVEGVDIEFLNFGKRGLILHFIIPKSPHVHYTSKRECYIRLNAQSLHIQGDKVVQLAYSKGSYSFEDVLIKINLEDILMESILDNYLRRINSNLTGEAFLKKQKLIKQEDDRFYPTAACVLLFDSEPQATLTTRCAIKVYRLHTTDEDYRREYLQGLPETIEGPIEEQIYKVIESVETTLKNVSYYVAGKLTKLHYPTEALKEILVNAVIHRDYSINDDIHVTIYDNRIEIRSPGKLPGYITKQNILAERYSRNPILVRLLHKLPNPVNHDIGEGLNTAYNAMKTAGLVAPEINELENSVLVTIRHRKIASLEDIIMEYLTEHEFVTNKAIRELSGENSENKVKKAFQKLRASGRIEPIDPDARPYDFKYRKIT
jgi:ATP-dependent DNA helicase RecG